MTAEEGGLL